MRLSLSVLSHLLDELYIRWMLCTINLLLSIQRHLPPPISALRNATSNQIRSPLQSAPPRITLTHTKSEQLAANWLNKNATSTKFQLGEPLLLFQIGFEIFCLSIFGCFYFFMLIRCSVCAYASYILYMCVCVCAYANVENNIKLFRTICMGFHWCVCSVNASG